MRNTQLANIILLTIVTGVTFQAEAAKKKHPSVITNAKKIAELEAVVKPLPANVDLALSEVAQLDRALQQTKKAIENIELIPGPAGPQGEKGEQGEPGADGADGADGPLAELNCSSGQYAIYNGVNWVCADAPATPVATVEDDEEGCFKGFKFTVNETGATPDWLQYCQLSANEVAYAKQWLLPGFPEQETDSLTIDYVYPPQVELFNSGFDDELIALSFDSIDLMNDAFSVDVHITSIVFGVDAAVKDWATGAAGQSQAKTLEVRQADVGFIAEFSNCLPVSHFAKPAFSPRLFEDDEPLMVEQSLTIRCTVLNEFALGDSPFVENAVLAMGSGVSNVVEVVFDKAAGSVLNGFDESYLGLPISLQLPAFNYSATSFYAEMHIFTASPLEISVLKETAPTDSF